MSGFENVMSMMTRRQYDVGYWYYTPTFDPFFMSFYLSMPHKHNLNIIDVVDLCWYIATTIVDLQIRRVIPDDN